MTGWIFFSPRVSIRVRFWLEYVFGFSLPGPISTLECDLSPIVGKVFKSAVNLSDFKIVIFLHRLKDLLWTCPNPFILTMPPAFRARGLLPSLSHPSREVSPPVCYHSPPLRHPRSRYPPDQRVLGQVTDKIRSRRSFSTLTACSRPPQFQFMYTPSPRKLLSIVQLRASVPAPQIFGFGQKPPFSLWLLRLRNP